MKTRFPPDVVAEESWLRFTDETIPEEATESPDFKNAWILGYLICMKDFGKFWFAKEKSSGD